MFKIDDRVKCKETNLVGIVVDREWERVWAYTILADDGQYFYRDEREIDYSV
ncbi:hypothetical protein [Bacillus thuringiensis]|uniref:hypothetical protein n=1 Tax=Bacillus thuringiensis TaxID=1428 RepID=UPI0021D690DF|nr:hypothetical protein [Bacillus thuringiensis]MCU7667875.1 hypothetical protein [Bacillus thuringiensis]